MSVDPSIIGILVQLEITDFVFVLPCHIACLFLNLVVVLSGFLLAFDALSILLFSSVIIVLLLVIELASLIIALVIVCLVVHPEV